MTDMQGALGVCQMKNARYIMNGRRKVAAWYEDVLNNETVRVGSDSDRKGVRAESKGNELSDYLVPPYVPEGYRHGYQSYVCLFTGGEDLSRSTKEQIDRINIKRNLFMEKLEARGIATRQGTHAVHTLEYYRKKNGFADEDFLMSYAADRLSIALPLYAEMSEEEFVYIVSNIKEVLK